MDRSMIADLSEAWRFLLAGGWGVAYGGGYAFGSIVYDSQRVYSTGIGHGASDG